MKGHRQVVAARVAGWKPAAVFVTVGTAPPMRYAFDNPESAMALGGLPEVWTDGELPALADLRFLRGCRVHLDLREGARWAFGAWWDVLVAAGVQAIYGVDPEGEVVAWQA